MSRFRIVLSKILTGPEPRDGYEYFQHSFPIDPSSMARFRKRIGWKKLEHFLKELLSTAIREGYFKERDLDHVNIDITD